MGCYTNSVSRLQRMQKNDTVLKFLNKKSRTFLSCNVILNRYIYISRLYRHINSFTYFRKAVFNATWLDGKIRPWPMATEAAKYKTFRICTQKNLVIKMSWSLPVMTQHIVMAVMLKKTAQRRIPVAVSTVPIRYSFRSVRYLISMRQGMAERTY